MKIKLVLLAGAIACEGSLRAATLSVAAAVQSRPDPTSPVISILSAGTEAPAPSDKAGPVPPGWIAVELAGPFEAYVKNKDLTKALDVRPGATVFLAPKPGAGVLTTFEKGDKADITGLHGSWTQVRLEKTIIGFVQSAEMPGAALASAPVPAQAPQPAAPPPSQPLSPPPSPMPADEQNLPLSRLFEGTLAGTHSLLSPRRPYDWQLVDASAKRIAYVDLSKLLLTDQLENYVGHSVAVLGTLKPIKNSQDLVIVAEGLRLK